MRRAGFRPAAYADVDAAREWYEGQRPGLGEEFCAAVDAAVASILAFPEAHPVSTLACADLPPVWRAADAWRWAADRGPELPWDKEEIMTKAPKQAVARVHPARSVVPAAKASKSTKASARKPTLLAGGNPQIAKGDGDAPVQAYIAAMPGWKRDLGRRLDALIVRTVPNVRKSVRWNSPFYGIEGQGWFLGLHVFTHHVKVAFFRGTSLRPVPPGESKSKETRYLDIHEDDKLDEKQLATWIKQAASIPGWDGGSPRLYGGVQL